MNLLARRAFLHRLALVSVAPLGPALLAAAGSTRKIPFGFSLYGMKGVPTADALKVCAQIGYDAVELVCNPGWPTEPAMLSAAARREIRSLLADLKLSLPALMEGIVAPVDDAVHAKNLERIKAAAELAHALSPDKPPVLETTLGGKRDSFDELKGRIAERVADWARVAAENKIVLAAKPHVGNAVNTPETALWLLQQVNSPALKLAYDFSHYQVRGFKLKETMEALLPHSVFVHIKDARGEPAKFEFLLPGDGDTDYAEFARLLRASSYRGAVVVEVSAQVSNKPGYEAAAAARKCFAKLAPALRME